MSLETGARLGRYEILTPHGVGGRGELQRVRDGRPGHRPAITVPPEPATRQATLRAPTEWR